MVRAREEQPQRDPEGQQDVGAPHSTGEAGEPAPREPGAPVVTPANVARYQYSNHLGTANLELDDDAEVISYEEFLLRNSLPDDDFDDPPNYSTEYQYDEHGNMTATPNIPGGLTWDDADRLKSSDAIGGGITYYVYDAAGQRVRKVTVNQSNSTTRQRLYFGS